MSAPDLKMNVDVTIDYVTSRNTKMFVCLMLLNVALVVAHIWLACADHPTRELEGCLRVDPFCRVQRCSKQAPDGRSCEAWEP